MVCGFAAPTAGGLARPQPAVVAPLVPAAPLDPAVPLVPAAPPPFVPAAPLVPPAPLVPAVPFVPALPAEAPPWPAGVPPEPAVPGAFDMVPVELPHAAPAAMTNGTSTRGTRIESSWGRVNGQFGPVYAGLSTQRFLRCPGSGRFRRSAA